MKGLKRLKQYKRLLKSDLDTMQIPAPEKWQAYRNEYTYLGDERMQYILRLNFPDTKWEHVMSVVATPEQTHPSYRELCELKGMFWHDEEVVLEVHPAKSDYINVVPDALHLWRYIETPAKSERRLRRLLEGQYSEWLDNLPLATGKLQVSVIYGSIFGDVVAIFGAGDFPTWEETEQVKKAIFGEDVPAVQFHLNPEFDLNRKFMVVLHSGVDMVLPPKELV